MNSESALRAHRGCSPFTANELETFRALLVKRQAELTRTFDGLSETTHSTPGDAVGGISSVPYHIAELASEAFEQELSIDLMGRAQDELQEIQAALERIDYRAYGLCADCGQAIPAVRLQAMPMAQFCIDCKSKLEQHP